MSQSIIKGTNELPLILNQFNKLLIVHGRSYERYEIKAILDAFPHIDFVDFTSNPLYEDVCKGVKLFNEEGCDAIVAVGGGSAIDVAKCIKLFNKMDGNINYLKQEKHDTSIPFIAIPTTAGTGSESTRYAVIYYEGNKQSVSHESIIPDYAVLIPELLEGLSIYQKKCTMLDALCQAIESWWSVNSTDESKEYSIKAIAEIKENWQGYILNNDDESAKQIMEAANYAGRAINITSTTAAHAMSYKITSLYKLPHGHAVSVCMPEVWEYMLEHINSCIDQRGAKYLSDTLVEIGKSVELNWFCELIEKLDISYPISDNKEIDVEVLTKSVNPERLKNNPISLSTEVLKEMYERIVK